MSNGKTREASTLPKKLTEFWAYFDRIRGAGMDSAHETRHVRLGNMPGMDRCTRFM